MRHEKIAQKRRVAHVQATKCARSQHITSLGLLENPGASVRCLRVLRQGLSMRKAPFALP